MNNDFFSIPRVVDQQENAKLVTVKAASSNMAPTTLTIAPGITAGEALRRLGLGPDYQLSKGTPDTVFGQDEPLYPGIQDGDLLFVTSRVDAG